MPCNVVTNLTFLQDVSGQVHGDAGGGSTFELQVAPGEQTPLQSPEQRQQHRPAGSAAAIHHHDLTLREGRQQKIVT